MRYAISKLTFIFLLLPQLIFSDLCDLSFDTGSGLLRDLAIVNGINCCIKNKVPVTYNTFLQGGHIIMPSARVGECGQLGVGYSSIPPYRNYNVAFMLTDHIELTSNYRIFSGVSDPIFGHFGFGDLSDRGINVKFAILHPEDSDYLLPGVAIGFDDFTGTKSFHNKYLVLTQVFPCLGLEASLGIAAWRVKGLFGGAQWTPWYKCENSYFKDLTLSVEYDATDYKNPKRERHPEGRDYNTRFNFGLKYRLWDFFDMMVGYVRGKELTYAFACNYNLGKTCGIIPKCDDPLPYRAPINVESLGCFRPSESFSMELYFTLCKLGLELLDARLYHDKCGRKVLRLIVWNRTYYCEYLVREHLENLMACITPEDIDRVIVEMEIEGFSAQEYHFSSDHLKRFREKKISSYELTVVSPLTEVTPSCCPTQPLYEGYRSRFCYSIAPKTHTLFGSTKGKFKYLLGVAVNASGFLPWKVFYRFKSSYVLSSNIPRGSSYDVLNPSQLMNVHSDLMLYLQKKIITIDEAYVQKNLALGCSLYTKLSAGLFSQSYGGFGYELLYYPVNSDWAIGAEFSWLRKRKYKGISFFSKIIKLDGTTPKWVNFPGYQWFIDFHYKIPCTYIDATISAGRFLAGDHGARFEVGRTFCSGLRVSFWYTLTDGHDKINGETYYDKGVAFSMPLDMFYKHSCRDKWGTALAAWLRDVGFRAKTGDRLYDLIFSQRR